MSAHFAAVILAAGAGSRMKSALPKVLHPLAGRPMLGHVLATVESLKPARVITVIGPNQGEVAAVAGAHRVAIQDRPLGTAHAVMAGRTALRGYKGDVLVLYGDSPMITAATLKKLLRVRRRDKAAVAVLGFSPADPSHYGRLVTDASGALLRIVEARDATPEERRISLCNSGVMAIDGELLPKLLAKVDNKNARGEYYLTDVVAIARSLDHRCTFVEGSVEEFQGINSRAELAEAESVLQARLRAAAMAEGVTLLDPNTVWLAWDTTFGRDVTIGPNVFFGPGVKVGNDVLIRGFCHIEGAIIGDGTSIGPFARLRPGAELGAGVHVGNFVEVKQATLGDGAKANHLAYIGDASVGAGTNIGAGVITVNYDGFGKHRTEIGANAFVGSNASLVAPIRVGDGAFIGAGSVITQSVPADASSVARPAQQIREGGAARYRARRTQRKKT